MILGINGSPRIGGNTDILLDRALEGAQGKGAKVEKIILNNLKFVPCQECEVIRDDGVCIIEDDMQPLYQKIKEADTLILASPIFFGSLTAQTKMMIDRFQCFWWAKYISKTYQQEKKRPGAFICVEASAKRDFFENAKSIIKDFFTTIDVDYKEELLCPGVDKKGAVLGRIDWLEKASEIGESMAVTA